MKQYTQYEMNNCLFAYDSGSQCALNGGSRSDNPYSVEDLEFHSWKTGWEDVDRLLRRGTTNEHLKFIGSPQGHIWEK